jgi:hypothetical protein
MSTIPEVLVARHCKMSVFAFSLITNECIFEEDADKEANHEEVIQVKKVGILIVMIPPPPNGEFSQICLQRPALGPPKMAILNKRSL